MSAANVYINFNHAYVILVSDLAKMFSDCQGLQDHRQWLEKEVTTLGPKTMTIYNTVKPNLESVYNSIHEENELIYQRDDIVMFNLLQLKEIFPRFVVDEKTNFFAKMKHLITQAGVCNSIGTNAPALDDIFDTFRKQNPNITDMNELRSKMSQDLFLDGEMRDKLMNLLCSENGMSDMLASLGPLVSSIGATAAPPSSSSSSSSSSCQNEDEDSNDDNTTENPTQETKDVEDVTKQTASHLYLSRKKQLHALRKAKKEREKKPQTNNMLNMFASTLSKMKEEGSQGFDLNEFKKTMNETMENPAAKAMFRDCVSQFKSPTDIPQMLQKMVASSGQQSPEMADLVKNLQGKSPMELQTLLMNQMKAQGQNINPQDFQQMFRTLGKK